MEVDRVRPDGLLCPQCGHGVSTVVDVRANAGNDRLRRRRECVSCRARFTTAEVIVSEERQARIARARRSASDAVDQLRRAVAEILS